jgi:hypothetical protein
MNGNSVRWIWLAALALGTAAGAAPWLENARAVPRPLVGGLGATLTDLAGGEPAWVAWSVPQIHGDHDLCCHDARGPDSRTACRLDDRSFTVSSHDDTERAVAENDRELWVLVRIGGGEVREVRAFSGHCAIDAGGAVVYTLDGVAPGASVEYLHGLIVAHDGDDLPDKALAALSFHDTAEAGRALSRFTASESPSTLRAKAAFWLGVTRGAESLGRLSEMARKDPSHDVREQAVFAISASDAPGSEAILIELARRDPRPDTRSKALFWLSQEAGERVADTLRDAVEDDPEVQVKEQAVFALSQLPADRGVPLLIDVARSPARHPAVRRAAMFWLGQSGDRRALEFFEAVLADGS